MVTKPFARERWTLNGESTLNAAAVINDTTITVNDAASFPTARFSIIIDDIDIHTVTYISTNTFTVDPVISTNHAQYSTVRHVLTNRSIDEAIAEASQTLLHPLNRVLDKSGTTLDDTDFTWLNQGSASTAMDDAGGIVLTMATKETYHQVRGKYITAPSTPWTCTAYVEFGYGYELWTGTGVGSTVGLIGRESGTGEFYFLALRGDVAALWQMDDVTTFNADVGQFLWNNNWGAWLQLEDDGTDVTGRISFNGYDYKEQWTENRTTFLAGGIDQIGFAANSGNGTANQLFHIKSWTLE